MSEPMAPAEREGRTPVIVYRVYESYHYSDESGTREYGTYSTLDAAKRRAREIWDREGYGESTELPNGGLHGHGMDWNAIYVQPITLDQPTEESNVGYT